MSESTEIKKRTFSQRQRDATEGQIETNQNSLNESSEINLQSLEQENNPENEFSKRENPQEELNNDHISKDKITKECEPSEMIEKIQKKLKSNNDQKEAPKQQQNEGKLQQEQSENVCSWVGKRFIGENKEEEVGIETVTEYKLIMVLMTADFCSACQVLKSEIAEKMPAWNEAGNQNIAVVILSADQDETAFQQTVKGGDGWFTIQFQDRQTQRQAFIQRGINLKFMPSAFLINSQSGKIVLNDAQPDLIEEDGENLIKKWLELN